MIRGNAPFFMKKRFLIPLIAALALPSALNANVDKETAEFCLKASDFAGCVETMKRGLDTKRLNDVEDGLRTWTRDTGTEVKMRTKSVKAVQLGKSYGRYLEWFYTRGVIEGSFYNWFTERTTNNQPARSWKVEADCIDYTVDWKGEASGWISVKNPDQYVGSQLMDPAREAKNVLDEFCPQMDRLVSEAIERDKIKAIEDAKKEKDKKDKESVRSKEKSKKTKLKKKIRTLWIRRKKKS